MKPLHKRGQTFNIFIVIIGIALFVHAFLIIEQKQNDVEDAYFGEQQLYMIQVSQRAENYRAYIDRSAWLGAKTAFSQFMTKKPCGTITLRGRQYQILHAENKDIDVCLKENEQYFIDSFKEAFIPFVQNMPKAVPGETFGLTQKPQTFHYAVEDQYITVVSEEPLAFAIKDGEYSIPGIFKAESPYKHQEWNAIKSLAKELIRDCSLTLENDRLVACVKSKTRPNAKMNMECEQREARETCYALITYTFQETDLKNNPYTTPFAVHLNPVVTPQNLQALLADACDETGKDFRTGIIPKVRGLGVKVIVQEINEPNGKKAVVQDKSGKFIYEKVCAISQIST